MSIVNLNLHTIVLVVLCHLIGDYVLQCDFIAQTKGKNWYHLFVHCALYCVPFLVVFGWTWQLAVIFISHLIIDPLKVVKGVVYAATSIASVVLTSSVIITEDPKEEKAGLSLNMMPSMM